MANALVMTTGKFPLINAGDVWLDDHASEMIRTLYFCDDLHDAI